MLAGLAIRSAAGQRRAQEGWHQQRTSLGLDETISRQKSSSAFHALLRSGNSRPVEHGTLRDAFGKRLPDTRLPDTRPSSPLSSVGSLHSREPSPEQGTLATLPTALTVDWPSREPTATADVSTLCPDLVVPADHDLSLLVPRLLPEYLSQAKSSRDEVIIKDSSGTPVFKATFSLLSSKEKHIMTAAGSGELPEQEERGGRCLVLSNVLVDTTVMAFCQSNGADPGSKSAALAIYCGSGAYFGLIWRRPTWQCGFEVVVDEDVMVHIASGVNGELSVTNGQGHSLALAHPMPGNASCRMIRIGPLVDAGLLTLAILASDLLESATRTRSSASGGSTPQMVPCKP